MSRADNIASDRSDIPGDHWIDRWVPAGVRPYLRLMRLDRPIGTWLLLFPCWWSVALAAPAGGWPDLRLMALFGLGAVVMRGAGCTLKDIVDRDLDVRVARTAPRPTPSGSVSVRRAAAFLALQLAVGLVILLMLGRLAILLGIGSLSLVAIYPFMKRITDWPQFVLGLTFNWGALMGWAAVRDDLAMAPLALYAAGIVWTLLYDTIYAHQDKEDDALIGVRSTALLFGGRSRIWLAAFAITSVPLFALAVALAGASWPAYAGVAVVGAHLAWQVMDVDFDTPADCLAKFRANRWLGWILLAGIVA